MPNGDYRGFKKQGDPLDLSAMSHNRWQSAATWVEGQRGNSAAPSGSLPEGLIYIQNNSGSDVDRFGILGISGIAISPTDNLLDFQKQAVLTGVTPAAVSHTGKFVICYEPIKDTKIGKAFLFGYCAVQTDTLVSAGTGLDVLDGSSDTLTTIGAGGATALYAADDADGNHWALIRFDPGPRGVVVSFGSYIDRGWYNGSIWSGNATDMYLTGIASSFPCYILNGPEYGSTSDPLNPAGIIDGRVFGQGTNSLGSDSGTGSGDAVLPYVLVGSFSYSDCQNGSGGS